MKNNARIITCLFWLMAAFSGSMAAQVGVLPAPSYDSKLHFMFWWEHVVDYSAVQLANEAAYIAQNIGSGPYIQTGFSVQFNIGPSSFQYPVNQAIINADVAAKMNLLDSYIAKARQAGIKFHLHMFSFFYQGSGNPATIQATQADQRNAQWYYTSPGSTPRLALSHYTGNTYWPTMSRYALQWMDLKERHFTAIGAAIAQRLYQNSDVMPSLDGDAEVQLSDSRIQGHNSWASRDDYADYSPFAVAEFRDWAAHRGEYCDACPSGKYVGQGRSGTPGFGDDLNAFNSFYGTSFTDWKLRIGDSSVYSGTGIPGVIDNGFEAPTYPAEGMSYNNGDPMPTDPPLLVAWLEFREFMVKNAAKDTMKWISSGVYNPTASAESAAIQGGAQGQTGAESSEATTYTIPADRYYSSQIAADHLGPGVPASPLTRYLVSGSGMATADVRPYGSPGWTGFSDVAGYIYRTQDAEFFARLNGMGATNWGLFEYNPYYPYDAPPPTSPLWTGWPCNSTVGIVGCITSELGYLRTYKPHVLVPFTYTDIEGLKKNMKDQNSGNLTNFGTAVGNFIRDTLNNQTPRQYLRGARLSPPKVQGLTGTSINSQVDLNWPTSIFPGNSSGFLWRDWWQMNRFEIYRSSKSDLGDEQWIGMVPIGNNPPTSFHDSGPLASNSVYYYRVLAVNKSEDKGEYSDPIPVLVCPTICATKSYLPLIMRQ